MVEALGLVDPIVSALPRGGLPVAAPIAHALRAPLDILLVRKIGASTAAVDPRRLVEQARDSLDQRMRQRSAIWQPRPVQAA